MAYSKERRHSTAKRAESSHSIMKTAPIAALMMPISGLFVLFISALCIFNTPSPVTLAYPVAVLALCCGSATGGFFAMKMLSGARGYLTSAIAALSFILLLLLCRIFIADKGAETGSHIALITFAAILASSQLGAFFGTRTTNGRRKRKRRRK